MKNDRMLQFQGCCLAIPLECVDSRAVAGCSSGAVSGCVAWIVLAVLSECWNVRVLLWFVQGMLHNLHALLLDKHWSSVIVSHIHVWLKTRVVH